jgi:hypothetical protein
MQAVTWILIRLLLAKTFFNMLAMELYLKLTKFTRRTREPKDLPQKLVRAFGFFADMWAYNLDVIRCSKRCLKRLAAQHIAEASLYGERYVIEVLCELALNGPVKMKRIYSEYDDEKSRNVVPLDVSSKSGEKMIIASLVDVEPKRERLRNLGVDEERIVVLVEQAR